ncbi:MAG: glycosyltransferase [Gaiellaceae bacterium]
MPRVSVVLSVHDDPYLAAAVESVLRQDYGDFELVVVEDDSPQPTVRLLDEITDTRLVRVRNEQRLGLAGSLNAGLERATSDYVARLDSDDVAFPDWLSRQLDRIEGRPRVAVVGSAMLDIDRDGRPLALHEMPHGPTAVRWQALFGSPFFHSTVLVDRGVLDANHLRYDAHFGESEDFDLWARLLHIAEGDNVRDPLVLHRVHDRQASRRRANLQAELQRTVALREIGLLAPELDPRDASGAWALGTGRVRRDADAANAFVALLHAFEKRHGRDDAVRNAAARRLARSGHVGAALRLAPALAASARRRRRSRQVAQRVAQARAAAWLAALGAEPPVRVAVVSPEPTPYRAPLFDRIGERPDVDLTVIYAAETLDARTWTVDRTHSSIVLRGITLPGARRVVRHDYPLTRGVARALTDARPDVVVISGWSTFAAQSALLWARARRTPYVLLVESHDEGPRPGWRRLVKGAVVPPVVRGAARVLAVGTLARESVVARGAPSDRVGIFANTVDVDEFGRGVDQRSARRDEVRAALHAGPEDVVVLSVGRLAPEKGMDVLVRAVAAAADPRVLLVLAGGGPQRSELETLARRLGVRIELLGNLERDTLLDAYVAADVFVLLSQRETWGVVVNEAAAARLPLVLTDRVGAARDLLIDEQNGFLVPAGDVDGAARAIRALNDDEALRRKMGERSRQLVGGWGYEPSVEAFVTAVREAASR